MLNKIELLAPAGNLEKLKIAIIYGADAVYFGGELFSLRASSSNFTKEQMKEGIEFAHNKGKKCYLTFNIFPHNEDIPKMEAFLEEIKDLSLDGFIVSDPGAISLIQEIIPDGEIHLSTQANMTNYRTASFWAKQGVSRVVLAREMSLEDIKTLRENLPEEMEIESFVHGAICISYSGRCLLSNFMVNRDANKGQCAHPCRWKYSIVEEQRPGEYYPIEEDERGTYIMNSRDLCMIQWMGDLIEAGVASAKIEGRMKSIFYVATVVQAYRRAIDNYYQGVDASEGLLRELRKVSNRGFTSGFYFQKPEEKDQNYETSAYVREYDFVGLVKSYNEKTKMAFVEQRNKMVVGDEVEIFGPDTDFFTQKLEVITDEEGNPMESAPHPQQKLYIKMEKTVGEHFMIRKKKGV